DEAGRIRFVTGIALLAGVGVMFVPEIALKGMHPVFVSILSNGLVLGTIVAIAAEQIQLRKKKYDNIVS
ncbi:purine/pyrimidine permease, partial [Bacillus haynesii]